MARAGQTDLHGGWRPCSWLSGGFPKERGPCPAMRKGAWLAAPHPCSHGPFPAPQQGWSLDPPPAVPSDGAACAPLFCCGAEACLWAWERPGEAYSRGLGSAQNRGFQSLDMGTESLGSLSSPLPRWFRNSGPSKALEVGKGPVSFPTAPGAAACPDTITSS